MPGRGRLRPLDASRAVLWRLLCGEQQSLKLTHRIALSNILTSMMATGIWQTEQSGSASGEGLGSMP